MPLASQLKGTFLVTGASSGIGLAVARLVAGEGCAVVGVARNRERLEAALAELPGEGHRAVPGDAASAETHGRVQEIGGEVGGYSGAVLAAGGLRMRSLRMLSPSELVADFEANVVSAVCMTKAVTRKAVPGCGIVWLSSVAALKGSPAFASYSGAKGYLIAAARSLALELAPKGIRVNVLVPGVLRTPGGEWIESLSPEARDAVISSHPLGLGQAEDVAEVAAFLLSDGARWMTGCAVVVDGGLSCG